MICCVGVWKQSKILYSHGMFLWVKDDQLSRIWTKEVQQSGTDFLEPEKNSVLLIQRSAGSTLRKHAFVPRWNWQAKWGLQQL